MPRPLSVATLAALTNDNAPSAASLLCCCIVFIVSNGANDIFTIAADKPDANAFFIPSVAAAIALFLFLTFLSLLIALHF